MLPAASAMSTTAICGSSSCHTACPTLCYIYVAVPRKAYLGLPDLLRPTIDDSRSAPEVNNGTTPSVQPGPFKKEIC